MKTQNILNTISYQCIPPNARIIGIDAGQDNLIYTSERRGDDVIVDYNLSKKEYYETTGINSFHRNLRKWMKEVLDKTNILLNWNYLKTCR